MAKKQKKSLMDKTSTKIIYKVIGVLIIIIFIVAIIHQYLVGANLRDREAKLLAEISKEEAIGNALKAENDDKDSPEFIEKMAREKLNMIKSNEILYIDKNSTANNKTPVAKSSSETTTKK